MRLGQNRPELRRSVLNRGCAHHQSGTDSQRPQCDAKTKEKRRSNRYCGKVRETRKLNLPQEMPAKQKPWDVCTLCGLIVDMNFLLRDEKCKDTEIIILLLDVS